MSVFITDYVVTNVTYYNASDIAQVIDTAIKGLETKFKAENRSFSHNQYAELSIRYWMGVDAMNVHSEFIFNEKGVRNALPRLVVSIQRKNNLFNGNLELLSELSGPEPKVPRLIVAKLASHAASVCACYYMSGGNGKGDEWDYVRDRGLISEESVIRIEKKSNAGTRLAARVAFLRDRLGKTKRSLGHAKNKIVFLETELNNLHQRCSKDEAKLQKDTEELNSIIASICPEEAE